jgi:DNA-binding CsgD family transcriptional regulator
LSFPACALQALSNREIADTVFVSEDTVATHLRLAFRKLDIPSRGPLAERLGAESARMSELDSQ